MRFNHHPPYHWLVVAAVAVIALFTFGHARGQGASASAAFEGRPSLAGAQGGLDSMPAPVPARSEVTLVPKKEEFARDVRSPTRKVKKAAKRTLERSRTGVGGFDAGGNGPN